jgi:decaprenyl-phosphate phosphoribosyltransferase
MANLSTKKIKVQNPAALIIQIVKVARPLHWIKNLALFAALIFSGNLLSKHLLITTLAAFTSFSLACSATYIFNDILDAKLDRLHPIKKFRPIASGKLKPTAAVAAMIAFVLISLKLASHLNTLFLFTTVSYLFLQAFYSLRLKRIPIIDILVIAAGFIIRVYAGAFVINTHLSVWFLLCVISVALFLASGKRRAELGIIKASKITTRKSLTKYPELLIDSYVTMFGNAAWLSWALFTFFESPPASIPVWIFLAEISRTTAISKLLMLTIPIVIFGIMRYQALIFENRSESPEKLLLTDKALVTSALLWITLVVWVLYGGVAGIG